MRIPVDELITELGLANADLVNASTEQLTFKMVQKARKGKPLTPNVKNKIINALQTLVPDNSPCAPNISKLFSVPKK